MKVAVLKGLPQFDHNSDTYRAAAENDTLHTVTAAEFPLPDGITTDDMEHLYDDQLSRSRTAYPIYQALRTSGPGQRCTYCRCQTADTLDHYIPKKVLGALSIEPWNLVPCCTRCNRNLSAAWETDPSRRMLHPYFMPDLGRWLQAEIVDSEDPYVVFRAEPDPNQLNEEIGMRIRAQFDALHLRETLGSIAIDELQIIQKRVNNNFSLEHLARDHLLEQAAELFELDTNSLRGVLCETAANDANFIQNHLRAASSTPPVATSSSLP